MDPITFKTTLRCADCVATITPYLDGVIGAGNWAVDMEHPEKLVTVFVSDPGHTIKVQAAFERAGYEAVPLMAGQN